MLVREAVARRVDGEQADDLVGERQRDGERRLDPGLGDARAVRDQVARPGRVRDREQAAAAVRPERELEQALRDRQMRPGQPAHAGRLEPAVLAQVDGDPVGAEELDDAVERRSRARARARAPPVTAATSVSSSRVRSNSSADALLCSEA